MSKRARQGITLSLIVALGVGVAVYVASPGRTAARVQEIADVGVFRVGYDRGLERASFTGRAMVQVFVPATEPSVLEALSTILADGKVTSNMATFTGVIVPVPPEEHHSDAELETRLKEEESRLQAAVEAGETLPEERKPPRFPDAELPTIAIQSLRGPLVAVLQGKAISVQGLSAALELAAVEHPPIKSPLLETCEEDPGVFDRLVAEGEFEAVRIAKESLEEIAPESPALQAATRALARVGK